MKTAAVISLILLLIVSLSTSGYLLMGQKKLTAVLDNEQKDAKKKAEAYAKIAEDFKKAKGNSVDNMNKLAAAEKKSVFYKKQYEQYEAKKVEANEKYEDLHVKLKDAEENQVVLMDEIANLGLTNKAVVAELKTTQSKLDSLAQQETDQGKQVEEKSRELEEIKKSLDKYQKLGLTPDNILELTKKRPVDLKLSGVSRPKPRVPEKLKEPLSAPASVKLGEPDLKLQPKE